MPDSSYVTLDGSHRQPIAGAVPAGDPDTDALVTLTLVLRRRTELPPGHPSAYLDSHTLAERHGAHPEDVAAVRRVADAHGLTVTGVHVGSRRVFVTGPLGTAAAVFAAELTNVRVGERVLRQRTGSLRLPAELDAAVVAVLGFDERAVARTHYRRHPKKAAAAATSLTALQVGAAYAFPANTTGAGQTVAIVELGGGFSQTDLNTFFSGLSITPPTVTAVGVDGASNAPGQDPTGADGEVLLDIEVAGALAPGADFIVYFGPNTDQGFIDAVSDAAHATPTPTAISISWGSPEDRWTAQSRTSLDAAIADAATLGVTVTVAAGDNGSGDGETDGKPHVDFPASSPNALACGGTKLELNSDGSIASEVVWNEASGGATGGGVSTVFPRPAWQAAVDVPNNPSGSTGRGVPDVAGNADPSTGYQVVIDGSAEVVGGTSAVAPLWAALVARLAQGAGRKLGLVQTTLYTGATASATASGFHDVTSGDNGAYRAAAGWDACTGLGTPDGAAILTALTG